MTGAPDGRNLSCTNDNHCYGYCDLVSHRCVGGGQDGMECTGDDNNCFSNMNDESDWRLSWPENSQMEEEAKITRIELHPTVQV